MDDGADVSARVAGRATKFMRLGVKRDRFSQGLTCLTIGAFLTALCFETGMMSLHDHSRPGRSLRIPSGFHVDRRINLVPGLGTSSQKRFGTWSSRLTIASSNRRSMISRSVALQSSDRVDSADGRPINSLIHGSHVRALCRARTAIVLRQERGVDEDTIAPLARYPGARASMKRLTPKRVCLQCLPMPLARRFT